MQYYRNLHIWTHIVLLASFLAELANSLRDVRVEIPHAVRRGEKALLKCMYDLEGDQLYSVKWYKGRREFYSFTPKDAQAMKVFPCPGIKVLRTSSNESQVVLDAVNLVSTGKYICEVSADAPSFHTLVASAELQVVEVPGKDPFITGIRPRYRIGDIVRGNCTSRHSRPAANLTWTINGYDANPSHVRPHKPLKETRGELQTAISGIHFVLIPQHFIYGKLKLRCTAHIHDIYWKSTEKSIEEDRHRHGSSDGNGNSINLINTFSDDYFDGDDGNLVDRSDTYMTHIKGGVLGDVSSLNASGATQQADRAILTHLIVYTLLICCTLQQMLAQLLWLQQQFNNQQRATRRPAMTGGGGTASGRHLNSQRSSVATTIAGAAKQLQQRRMARCDAAAVVVVAATMAPATTTTTTIVARCDTKAACIKMVLIKRQQQQQWHIHNNSNCMATTTTIETTAAAATSSATATMHDTSSLVAT